MAADDPLKEFTDLCIQGMSEFGCQMMGQEDLKNALESAGFTDVQCIVKKVPISTWPQDKYMRTIGLLMKESILESLEALAAKPLAALGIPFEMRHRLVARIAESLRNSRAHRYVQCCFCFGRKDELYNGRAGSSMTG